MPQAIPRGLTREHVLWAIAKLDAGVAHPFGAPTGYELVHEGRRYPPKAVVGLACQGILRRILAPEEFSGGEAPGQANFVLRELGFAVEAKGAGESTSVSRDWSTAEVDLTVADYFRMLASELAGEAYSKADHNRRLRPLLDGRSRSSVEFKHQNISAVLASLRLPYIEGYKPARNFQGSLVPAVETYLTRHPDLLDSLAKRHLERAVSAPVVDDRPIEEYFEGRPEPIALEPIEEKPWHSRRGRRVDFAQLDADNRVLGNLGEEFALAVERRRLLTHGREDLAARVERVSVTCGDGLGFDLLSFDEQDDTERYIEVKTTGLGKAFPFYVTATEVRCSEDCAERFHLYRVFDFGRSPRLYVVTGALSRACRLEPTAYRASI